MLVSGGGEAETQADHLESENQGQTRGPEARSISGLGGDRAELHVRTILRDGVTCANELYAPLV